MIFILLSTIILSCSSPKNISKYQKEILQTETKNSVSKKSEFFSKKERKVLFSALISLTVKKPDTANLYIQKIAQKYNGYTTETSSRKTVIRIKSNSLENALNDISKLGKIQNKNISGQDVTDEYWDYKIRLDNAEKARKKYLELLAKAENVEEALKTERELERLNEKIDLIKGKINRINHLSDFSTITIDLKEKKKLGVLGYITTGIYHSIKWLFVRN